MLNIKKALLTVPMKGLTKENANRAWLPMVIRMDTKQQTTFRPTLSTTIPKSGEETADIVYTMLLTVLAWAGVRPNFLMKKTLKRETI